MFFGYSEEEMLGRSVVGTIIPETVTSGLDPDFMIKDIGIIRKNIAPMKMKTCAGMANGYG